ncbi:MAG: flagellar P-ring protein [Phycisphaerales bacterium]|nr:MAG: flagellar P-ring protein [Phycisphaerales bacterium]
MAQTPARTARTLAATALERTLAVLLGRPVAAALLGWAVLACTALGAQDAGVQLLPRRAELDVREMVDFANATTARLIGVGLVVGLNGTGDEAGVSATTEPLVEFFRKQGYPIASNEQLEQSRSVALVTVTATIPNTGARQGDRFDVHVASALGATSLAGGELLITPLRGHLPGDAPVAFASGRIVIDDPANPKAGRVPMGLEIVHDIITYQLGPVFDLKVKPQYAGHAATELIASTLNESYYNSDQPGLPPIAQAIDDRIVRVSVPEADRESMVAFVKFILSRRVRDPALLNLPARVIVNRRTGAIVATADVDISPVGVTHEQLSFTVTQPPIQATPQAPITTQERWAQVASSMPEGEVAKLSDLLSALRALDVPVRDQIDLLAMMHQTGALHAEFIEQ